MKTVKLTGLFTLNYRPSFIPAGRLDIPLILNLKSPHYITLIKIKEFVTSLRPFDYIAKETEPSSSSSDEEKETNLIIQESSPAMVNESSAS